MTPILIDPAQGPAIRASLLAARLLREAPAQSSRQSSAQCLLDEAAIAAVSAEIISAHGAKAALEIVGSVDCDPRVADHITTVLSNDRYDLPGAPW